jgi:hypothetical protein
VEYALLDVRALAHAGLAVVGERGEVARAVADFRAARGLTSAAGVVAGVLRWLDTLAPGSTLDDLRPVAAGRESARVS